MRIRRKPWARPELAACPYFITDPASCQGHWRDQFPRPEAPLHLELGCGKGGFMAQQSLLHPENNYVAIDIKSEMLGLARRKIQAAYDEAGLPVDNVRLTAMEIELIHGVLNEADAVDRLYINFCNPWPTGSQNKKRLTHIKQLIKYAGFLKDGAEIWFKTDHDQLFLDSLEYFTRTGFVLRYVSFDLHESGFTDSPATEHEKMFTEEGIATKFCIAVFNKAEAQRVIPRLIEENPKYRLQILPTREYQL